MKIGLIGFGSIGERHYNNLKLLGHKLTVFSGRSDINVDKQAKNWKEFFGFGPYDAIFIANETAKHLDTVKKCLVEPPKAIFLEKPISHSLKGLERLAGQIKKANLIFWVGYNLHFFRPLLEIKKILDSGIMGKIYYMRVFVGQDLRVWRKRDYRRVYSSQKKQGGGVLLDLVHDLNYPAWLLGESLKPIAGAVKKLSDLKIDVEDFAESILISDSGVLISLHQDYLRNPGKRFLEIAGEKGVLSWDSSYDEIILEKAGKISRKSVKENRNIMYQKEIKWFLDKVKNKKIVSNLNEAIRDLKIIEKLKKRHNN